MTYYGDLPRFAAADNGAGADAAGNDEPEERSVESILTALESVPVDLERLIADRTPEDLQRPSEDGGWGMIEILPHMLDWEQITHDRVWRILAEERPVLEEYDDSLWAIEHEYSSQDPHQVLQRFTELRRELVDRLRELGEAEWRRTAVLGARGEITLRGLMDMVVRHDARRLEQARNALG